MKTLILTIAAVLLTFGAALAQQNCYSWEDGGLTLGGFLPDSMYLANSDAQAYDGTHSLEIYEIDSAGTPQAYVAWITDLAEGDQVTATIQTYDLFDGNPSVRIWGHWTEAGGDIDAYVGSAGGNSTYSGGPDWVELAQTWTVDAAHAGMGLVVEVRPYNADPFTGSNWVDQLCVDAPGTAVVHFPEPIVAVEASTWGTVKTLFH